MDVHLTKCCWCIPLKAGVVIASSLWLIYGVSHSVSLALSITSLNDGTNVFKYISTPTISIIVFYGLITMGSIFGLLIVTFMNTSSMMSLYSKVSYGITGIEIASRLILIIVLVSYKSTIHDKCMSTNGNDDVCNKVYVSALTYSVAISVISIPLSIYFSFIIIAYAHKRKKKEEPESNNDDDDDDA